MTIAQGSTSGHESTAVPAGWYADPADSRSARWWDGSAWSAHVRPVPSPPPVPAPASDSDAISPSVAAAWAEHEANGGDFSRRAFASAAAAVDAVAQTSDDPLDHHTVWGWILAVSPLLGVLVIGLVWFEAQSLGIFVALGWARYLLVVLPVLGLIALDRRALTRRGYGDLDSRAAWIVPPVGYLILRSKSLRGLERRAWPVTLVFWLSLGVAGVLVATALMSGAVALTATGRLDSAPRSSTGSDSSTVTDPSTVVTASAATPTIAHGAELSARAGHARIAQALPTEFTQADFARSFMSGVGRTDRAWTVSCPSPDAPMTSASSFVCTAQSPSGGAQEDVEVLEITVALAADRTATVDMIDHTYAP